MDQGNVQPYRVDSHKWSLVLAVVVTANVFIRVVVEWHALGILSRLVAVVLLANLVIMPINVVRRQKTGRPKMGSDQQLTFAYMSVMLATMVFTLR
jgi:hypothetical protein